MHPWLEKARPRIRAFFVCAVVLVAPLAAPAQDAARGEYLAKLGGCKGCHTESKPGAVPFAGGRELKSPFGSFFGPNITPHPTRGIGAWQEADFIRAMREGVRPDGANYFPAFPYTAFTRLNDSDLRDLWAYLRTLPPSDRQSQEHGLSFPFNIRLGVTAWKQLNFTPGPLPPVAGASPELERGRYIVETLAHCGECHTPRDMLGGLDTGSAYAGAKMESGKVPNITPTRLAKWSDGDLKEFLSSGMTPEGDFAGGEMAEVIRNSTSAMRAEDLAAIIVYLRSLKPQPATAR